MSVTPSKFRQTFENWRSGIHTRLLSWQIYNALKAGSVFVIAILFARGGASLTFLAEYESLLLWAGMLSFFFVSGFSQAWISWTEHLSPLQQSIAPQILFVSLQWPALLTGSVFVLSSFINKSPVALIFGIYLCFHLPALAVESVYLRKQQSSKILALGIWTYLSYIILVAAVFIFTKSLIGVTSVMLAWSFFRWMFTLKQVQPQKSMDRKLFRDFIKHASPVALSLLLGGSLIYLNALMVEFWVSDHDFVLYRYGAREFPLFMIMANAFSTVYSGVIASRWHTDDQDEICKLLKNRTRRLMHQLFPMSIALMMSAPFLFRLAYGESLAASWMVFSIFLLLTLSRVMFPQTFLMASKNTKVLMTAGLLELVTGLLLSWWLIPVWGIKGAAWALVIAFLFEKLFLFVRCHTMGIPYLKAFPWKTMLIYSMVLLVFFVFIHFMYI